MGYYDDRILKLDARIEAYETAAEGLISGAIQSYKLNTGQSEQWVTKLDIFKIEEIIDTLISRRARYQRKASGAGDIYVEMGF